jgi:hypothetical protein
MNRLYHAIVAVTLLAFALPAKASQDFSVGQTHTFWQLDVIKAGTDPDNQFYQAGFTCVRRGARSYIFVQNDLSSDVQPTEEYVELMFQHFESKSADIVHLFGEPSDVDGNQRFVVLLSQIRDWFYYNQNTEGQIPIQGYMWPDFAKMNGNDYLTMATNAPTIDATGTLLHEFTHNIYDTINPTPASFQDRGLNEALANYTIRVNGTLEQDSYFAFQKETLTRDLTQGKLLNPFNAEINYLDPASEGFHHAYAAGYFFLQYLMDNYLQVRVKAPEFFRFLIHNLPNAPSQTKLAAALIEYGILENGQTFESFFYGEYRAWLESLLLPQSSPPANTVPTR